MQRRCLIATIAALLFGGLTRPTVAQPPAPKGHAQGDRTVPPAFRFASIDGGDYDMATWRGQPVLVVNTASMCGFTGQYDELQALHEEYGPRGLVVLAVPSNDFRQELASDAAVAEFCEVNFNLTLPMTTITAVRGEMAHPFYRWLSETHGYAPTWNFNKVLLDGEGRVVETYGSSTRPGSTRIRREIEARLPE